MSVKVKQAVAPAEVKKPKVKDALKPGSTSLSKEEREAVNRMVELEEVIGPVRAAIKEFDKLKTFLAASANDAERFEPDQPVKLVGDKGTVEFGPVSHPRVITDKNLAIVTLKEKMGGYKELLEVLKINMGDIDTYLTPAESATFTELGTGGRSIKSVRPKGE